MALPSSGQISLSQFNTELGNSATAQISLNDAAVRDLIGKSSGAQASFSEYYGASAIVNVGVTISSNTSNYNIYSNRSGSYVSGKTAFTLTINTGVTVSSTSAGGYALDTGTGWTGNDSITIVNNGTVVGAGGPGGGGATSTMSTTSFLDTQVTRDVVAGAGTAGGTAFRAQYATTITNNGTFAGGGGGGGGAGITAGGGGAGGRMKNAYVTGSYISTNYLAPSGSAGTSIAGGVGGQSVFSQNGALTQYMLGGTGGAQGTAGTAGSSVGVLRTALSGSPGGAGGAAGKYAEGSSNITWSTTGTRVGGAS